MTKDQIIEVLETIGRLLELKGENAFKVRAYANAIRALETAPLSAAELADPEALKQLDGIGTALAEKIATLAATGRLEYYENLRAEFPPDIFELFEIQGLGAKKIKILYERLNIHSLSTLEHACKAGKVATLEGFGAKTQENLLKAIEEKKHNAGQFLFSEAAVAARAILDDLRNHPAVSLAEVAGSFRRRKEIVRDLDFLVSTKKPEEVMEFFVSHELVESVIAHGATKSSVRLKNGIQCDLRAVTSAEYPYALVYFTGSKEHNIVLRNRALERGWSLNEYRFSIAENRKKHDPLPEVHEERDVYRALGLDFIPPELREDSGEFAAAEEHELPELLQLENLRGTFHNHTTASDGRATLQEMAEAAAELGLEYLGIADHSKSSFQANGLDAKRLAEQCQEIDRYNEESGEIRLLKGVECDILKDGSLDFPDEVLEKLDYVVASVHNAFSLGEAEMTRRIIKAMSNPYVTMLGHMTGRLLLARKPYAVSIPDIIDAAAELGVIIELNANPRRLDMDWRWWPLAKKKGVLCSINPDAHSTQGLQDLYFGVGTARKGWLTRRDVINTLPLKDVLPVLAKRRKRT